MMFSMSSSYDGLFFGVGLTWKGRAAWLSVLFWQLYISW